LKTCKVKKDADNSTREKEFQEKLLEKELHEKMVIELADLKLRHALLELKYANHKKKHREYKIKAEEQLGKLMHDQNMYVGKVLEKVQDNVKEIALAGVKKSTVTNKYAQYNLTPIPADTFQKHIENTTLEDVKKGLQHYIDVTVNGMLGHARCTDLAREKVVVMQENGEILMDPGLSITAPTVIDAVSVRNSELLNKEYRTLMDDTLNKRLGPDDELQKIMELTNIQKIHSGIMQQPQKNLVKDISKEACKKLVNST